ncbi:hypothetical protein L596_001318 [Steinernema carpocapsae]|uniref:Uncharacterized protein n=1 Tax=Steinernema carpocapsae TaxID=34508 RepID=A0A4U8UMY3_STECR|nr:hypothetical protein L596_001318 [Steinernema carpocapsae]
MDDRPAFVFVFWVHWCGATSFFIVRRRILLLPNDDKIGQREARRETRTASGRAGVSGGRKAHLGGCQQRTERDCPGA